MIPRARTRTIRDVARHKQRNLETELDMPPLYEGACYGMLITHSSMVAVAVHCARWLRGADLTLATWAISPAAIDVLRGAKAIRSITLLLDVSQNTRKPKVMEAARAAGVVHTVCSHAKVSVLLSEKSGIVLAGSANATRSRGAEWLNVDVGREYALAVRETLMSMV